MHKNQKYNYLSDEIILMACRSDNRALSAVIKRYERYARKIIMKYAKRMFSDGSGEIPVEDILQIVWLRLIKAIIHFDLY